MFLPGEVEITVISYYIDLGTGSYMAQMAIAVVLGGLATVGFYWRRVVSWFKEHKSGNQNKKS